MLTRRRGWTLVEVLVSVGILSLLVGLLFPAVMALREEALRAQSMNNLKQIGLAVQSYAGDHGGNLPGVHGFGQPITGDSLFFELLPYVEEGKVYYKDVQAGVQSRGTFYPIRTYLSPADPTAPSATVPPAPGLASYAANVEVFRGKPHLPRTFKDGTSNTVAFAEHYCTILGKSRVTYFQWAQTAQEIFTATTQEPYPPGTLEGVIRPATFAEFPRPGPYDPARDDVHPVKKGNDTIGSIPELSFQVRPRTDEADPRIPQTPHRRGMLVGTGDGAVRTIAGGVAPNVFWSLVTPRGGETVHIDW